MLTLQKTSRNSGAQEKLILYNLLHKRVHQLDSFIDISKGGSQGKLFIEISDLG